MVICRSVLLTVSIIISVFTVDRIMVILVAQVFNGCLLPIFATCLLICINDQQFMGVSPQKGWSNIFLVVSVTITMLLSSNVLIQKVMVQIRMILNCIFQLLSWLITSSVHRLIAASCVALAGIVGASILTGLTKPLLQSFKKASR